MSNPKDIGSGIEGLLWQEATSDLENERQAHLLQFAAQSVCNSLISLEALGRSAKT